MQVEGYINHVPFLIYELSLKIPYVKMQNDITCKLTQVVLYGWGHLALYNYGSLQARSQDFVRKGTNWSIWDIYIYTEVITKVAYFVIYIYIYILERSYNIHKIKLFSIILNWANMTS